MNRWSWVEWHAVKGVEWKGVDSPEAGTPAISTNIITNKQTRDEKKQTKKQNEKQA